METIALPKPAAALATSIPPAVVDAAPLVAVQLRPLDPTELDAVGGGTIGNWLF